ncbi:MAG TPA: class I SAM-dependent methyltransferase [Chitinophagales bacterium]|nr:class I SAM-dependent methyltransferase [Chitinophagales bacterium]
MDFPDTPEEIYERSRYENYPNKVYESGFENVLTEYLQSGNILDFGCGQSPYIINMIEGDYRFWAVDKNLTALGYLRKRIHDIDPEYFRKVNEVESLQSRALDGVLFDGIILSNILHFFPEGEYQQIVADIARVAKKGCIWYVQVHSDSHPLAHKEDTGFEKFFTKNDLSKLFPSEKYRVVYYAEEYKTSTLKQCAFNKEYAETYFKDCIDKDNRVSKYLKKTNSSSGIKIIIQTL